MHGAIIDHVPVTNSDWIGPGPITDCVPVTGRDLE